MLREDNANGTVLQTEGEMTIFIFRLSPDVDIRISKPSVLFRLAVWCMGLSITTREVTKETCATVWIRDPTWMGK